MSTWQASPKGYDSTNTTADQSERLAAYKNLRAAAIDARPPHTHDHTSAQIPCRACALDAALAVLDRLDGSEGGA